MTARPPGFSRVRKIIYLLIVAWITSDMAEGQVVLHGRIHDYDGESVVYYRPVLDGISAPYSIEVHPTFGGRFKVQYNSSGLGSMTLSYKGVVFRLLHDDNAEIFLEIKDPARMEETRVKDRFLHNHDIKQKILISLKGAYEAVNRFYNSSVRTSYYIPNLVDGIAPSHLVNSASTPTLALRMIDSLAQIEIKRIRELPWPVPAETERPSPSEEDVRSFLIDEVRAFYSNVFLNAIFLKRKDHIIAGLRDSIAAPDIYNREWEVVIEQFLEDLSTNLTARPNSPDYTNLMEAMVYTHTHYQEYEFPQTPGKTNDEFVLDSFFNFDTLLFRDTQTQFAWQLRCTNIFSQNQLYYSPVLLHALYQLKAAHPHAAHLEFYAPQIAKIEASLERAKRPYGREKIIGGNVDSFSELVERFKGENLLVDIWATWCHPCIADFQHKEAIMPFVEKGQLAVLYISIDKPQWDDRWRQSIKINQLAGHHFRADESFIEDMWAVIGDYEGAIPRYVLIDKEGKIFKRTAARPGAGLAAEIGAWVGEGR